MIKICSFFNITVLDFATQDCQEVNHLFLNEKEYKEVKEANSKDMKLTVYKKLFLESKIENVEARLRSMHKAFSVDNKISFPTKYKIHVII